MTAMFYPLLNLRISLQDYLDNPEEPTGVYEQALSAILEMHASMADYMLSNKDNSILKRYMHTWQEQIRLLFDEIPSEWTESMDLQAEEDNPNESLNQKYQICFECFRLIREMQLGYPAFFDSTCIPPAMYVVLVKSRYHYKWLLTSQWIGKRKKRFNKVWEIIDDYLRRIWNVDQRFSYGELSYACNLIDQLMQNIQTLGNKFNAKALYTLLIYMNFNDIGFSYHVITDVKETMEGYALNDEEKIEQLKEFQREMEVSIVRTDCTLDPGNPPINLMLMQWAKRQLEVLQT